MVDSRRSLRRERGGGVTRQCSEWRILLGHWWGTGYVGHTPVSPAWEGLTQAQPLSGCPAPPVVEGQAVRMRNFQVGSFVWMDLRMVAGVCVLIPMDSGRCVGCGPGGSSDPMGFFRTR
jgi:hypothetical protein